MGDIRIPTGTRAALQERVEREKTVAHLHPGMPEVYGTPMMIHLMELAAATAIAPFLPPGWVSVGVAVDVRHLAATPVGATVTARAELTSWDGTAGTFAVEAHDGTEIIGSGTHRRAAVDLERFERSAAAKRGRDPNRPPRPE